ncbi:hypothetical protein ACQ4M4_12725 [Leptolyngbya sp. AN02str]|uniref:hypothetical protein n=1 Tax=Leptolyngbya sp. AN02str TaxID=3423363 RepID=UPI003D324163
MLRTPLEDNQMEPEANEQSPFLNPWEATIADFFKAAKEMNAGQISMTISQGDKALGALVILLEDVDEYLDLAAIEATQTRLEAEYAASEEG